MDNQLFWDRVKDLMKQKSFTQSVLADATSVTVPVIRNWIYRNILPDAEQAVKIAIALGTTVEYLVSGEGPKEDTRYDELKKDLQSLLDKKY